MRLKILSLFIITQIASFGIFKAMGPAQPVYAIPELSETVHTVADDSTLRFSAVSSADISKPVSPTSRSEVLNVLSKLPSNNYRSLKNIVLDYDPKAHRGYGGRSKIILRASNIDKEEFFGVLIHEIGHTADIGYLRENERLTISRFMDRKNPVYESDPSLSFYQISWESSEKLSRTANNQDFVSGYAMTDPFEDFAETYAFYVLHNKTFKGLTHTSEALSKKYFFMRDVVFKGEEFDTGKEMVENSQKRPWDITVLSYDLDLFLSEA